MGSSTNCQLSLEWDGDGIGFGSELIDGYSVGPAPVLTDISGTMDDDIADDSLEGDGSEDFLDDEYTEHLYLPLIGR